MKTVLITGGAGFIGSHTVRRFLEESWAVRVLDNLSTGTKANLPLEAPELTLIEGSILDRELLQEAMTGVDACIHLAALPSVPRSVADPWPSNAMNVDGSLAVFLAAREAGVKRVVSASSSSIYGEAETFPLQESLPRNPLSPYAVSKAAAEMYGEVFSRLYAMEVVSLRYFNVFGPRQDPNSAYAAVIPRFITRMLEGQAPEVYGDGEQARDFTYVANVAEANWRAATLSSVAAGYYNVACGGSESLNSLVGRLNQLLDLDLKPAYLPPRPGDIPRSCADIARAQAAFGYEIIVPMEAGLEATVAWYRQRKESE